MALKGHLLLEVELNDVLEFHLKNPDALADARLTFHQKLCLTRALLPKGLAEKWIWNAAHLLNKLRNKLVHNLEPEDVDELVVRFLSVLEDPDYSQEEGAKVTLDTRFKRSLALLCGVVSGWNAMARAAETGAGR